MSSWQLIFRQSKANGCLYKEGKLADHPSQWFQETWFQQRLHCARKTHWPVAEQGSARARSARDMPVFHDGKDG